MSTSNEPTLHFLVLLHRLHGIILPAPSGPINKVISEDRRDVYIYGNSWTDERKQTNPKPGHSSLLFLKTAETDEDRWETEQVELALVYSKELIQRFFKNGVY